MFLWLWSVGLSIAAVALIAAVMLSPRSIKETPLDRVLPVIGAGAAAALAALGFVRIFRSGPN